MQNNSKLNTMLLLLLIILVGFGIWQMLKRPAENNQIPTIDTGSNVNTETPCPFMLAKDSMFKLVLTTCSPAYLPDGTILEDGYSAAKIEIRKLDDTVVKTFEPITKQFSQNEAGTMTAKITHDPTNSYVFLDQGTWISRSLEVFSLNDGRMFNDSYMGGVITKNGYIVYTSDDGLKNVHPEVDQSNATNVVYVRLSDFAKNLLFAGDAKINYQVNLDGLVLKIDDMLPFVNEDFIIINKNIWEGKSEQIKVPISNLK